RAPNHSAPRVLKRLLTRRRAGKRARRRRAPLEAHHLETRNSLVDQRPIAARDPERAEREWTRIALLAEERRCLLLQSFCLAEGEERIESRRRSIKAPRTAHRRESLEYPPHLLPITAKNRQAQQGRLELRRTGYDRGRAADFL